MNLNIILAIIIVLLIVALLILVIKLRNNSSVDSDSIMNKINESETEKFNKLQLGLFKEIADLEKRLQDVSNENNEKIKGILHEQNIENVEERAKSQELVKNGLIENSKTLIESLNSNMDRINKLTSEKLSEIQGNVNEKLDKSLNERLDENFKQVGDRLEALYKSLGEIKNLESGVANLNKTLSNVKTRGVFGEMQLDNILANILDLSQYEKQIPVTKRGSEPVDFAIKIPDKEDKGGFIYLPIDSKFPSDIYNKIIDASRESNTQALEAAQKELKTRIEAEAKSISDKYVNPPDTTDFAIMFLPTESLYSEVLRIDGLAQKCQEKYKIVISGPMSITALLNSLSIGFKYLTVNKKTNEIRKALVQFKKDFEKFDELIEKTQKSIDQAKDKSIELSRRNGFIKERLSKVEKYEIEDSNPVEAMLESSSDSVEI